MVIGWASTCAGSAARHLGLLATMLGHRQTAAAHFEQAIKMNRAMGARPWLVRTQLQYAQALLADPQAGDQQRAVRMLHDALAGAQELELRQLADSATKTLALTRTRPATAPTSAA